MSAVNFHSVCLMKAWPLLASYLLLVLENGQFWCFMGAC